MSEELTGGSHDADMDRHVAKRAGEILEAEAGQPGSQDPEDVAWAVQHALELAARLRASQQRLGRIVATEHAAEQQRFDKAFDGIVDNQRNGENDDN